MHYVTQWISPKEPCYGLWEGAEIAPIPGAPNGATDWRWLQKVFVVRGDTIAKHITDFGPADDYEDITPIFLPNEGTDSVAALQALAEKNRRDTYWQTRVKEMLAESTLISDLIEQEEKLHEIIRNRTSIGPVVTVQRNGYDHNVVTRQVSQQRMDRTGIIPQRSR